MRKSIIISLLTLFTLLLAEKATIKVLSPNGGEIVNEGGVLAIRWQDDLPENVKIELVKETQTVMTITSAAPSNGSYDWSVPSGIIENGSRYKIKIGSVIATAIYDLSDNFFTIKTALEAGTQVTAGNVSGIWTKANSPYHINGNITIPAGSVLSIQPGVKVTSKGQYHISIKGRLIAAGSASEPITLTATNTDIGWNGLYFNPEATQTTDSSILDYCKISHVKKPLTEPNSARAVMINRYAKVNINHSSFFYNFNCILLEAYGKLNLSNTQFYNNQDFFVIGFADNSSLKISNSLFYKNKARAVCSGAGAQAWINNCTFADQDKGAIEIYSTTVVNLSNCILWNNCMVSGNELYFTGTGGVANITNSIIDGGYWGFHLSEGIYNGNYTNNLEINPQFTDPANNKYLLNPVSPAINKGINQFTMPLYDLAGNARIAYGNVDMGCYEFSTSQPVIIGQDTLAVNEDNLLVIQPSDLKIVGGIYPANHNIEILPGSHYSVNNNIVLPEQNYNGNLLINLRVTDNSVWSDPFSFLAIVNPVNDAPLINLPDSVCFYQGFNRVLDCAHLIADVDNQIDQLTMSASGGNHICLQVAGKKVTFTAPADYLGSELVTVSVKDQDGRAIASDTIRVFVRGASSIYDDTAKKTTLTGIYPNPFNNTATISYQLAAESNIKLAVYNSKGEMVKRLIDGSKHSGTHQIDLRADELNSGLYFCRLITGDKTFTQKIMLLK